MQNLFLESKNGHLSLNHQNDPIFANPETHMAYRYIQMLPKHAKRIFKIRKRHLFFFCIALKSRIFHWLNIG